MLLFVVDILKEEATFISASESAKRMVEQAYACTVSNEHTAVLPGVLSRKKQIMPTLEAAARSPKAEAPPAKAAHVAEGARVPVAA